MTENFSLHETVRLTQYSHGAGCGCKISPSVLSEILKDNESIPGFGDLLVGNHSRDDAAVLDLGNGTALISTTDFFMPVVDDPFQFGLIAATNAISDVYAMGGKPILAIAILGWPVGKIDAKVAGKVIEGGRAACEQAGIPLAGGHSIDSPEPIFGLAVNGIVNILHLKKNNTAVEGDLLFLTKKIGTGILTTASKKGIIKEQDLLPAIKSMSRLNKAGTVLGTKDFVHALTDVTGFGLLGHLTEMMQGSKLQAELSMENIPVIEEVYDYIAKGCIPGGTNRNWDSYGKNISSVSEVNRVILSDPQTSGGLLVAVHPGHKEDFIQTIKAEGLEDFAAIPIGKVVSGRKFLIEVIEKS
jgi:selenide, water dikinase